MHFVAYVDDQSYTRDQEVEQEWSGEAMAVLTAAGFDASRHGTMLTVRNPARESQTEDVMAVVAASDLDIVQPTANEWHVAVAGRRGAYEIRRTGNGDRTRFAVSARGYTVDLARNLRTMRAAIDTIKKHMGGTPASDPTEEIRADPKGRADDC